MSGKVISGPAAVLLVAFFFFPWILVFSEGSAVSGSFSGYQLAMGIPPDNLASELLAGEIPAEPILFAAPLAGIISLILLAVTLWKADFEQHAAWGQIILAAAALLILLLEWWRWQPQSDPALTIRAQPALWMSFIALLALTAGAIIDLILWYRAQAPSPPAPVTRPPRQSFPSPPPAPKPHLPGAGQAPSTANDLQTEPGPGKVTLVDDDLLAPPAAGQPTLVEDDLYKPPGAGQPTIVDDGFAPREPANVKTEVLPFRPEPMARFLVESGPQEGRQIDLYGRAAIGRLPENNIVIDDTAMSSYHARIEEENGRFTIIDLNSTNGVYISRAGQKRWRKETACILQNGDRIKLGRTILQFIIQE